MADLKQTLIEADALLRIARTAMQKMRLEGLGSDCRLSHEVRMFALEFSRESRDGPGVLQVNGTGRALKCLEALRAALAQQAEPVAAQHRFRHPQKSRPDWSPWQLCQVRKRPAWEIDSQGYEVEYRNLYTAPPPQQQAEPCDMGQMCLNCQPRGPNGECPDKQAAREAK